MRSVAAFAACFLSISVHAQTQCPCDVSVPETLNARQCSLGKITEEQPKSILVFFVPDANPKKPNRLLCLPREQSKGMQRIADLTPEARLALWTESIDKAKENGARSGESPTTVITFVPSATSMYISGG